MKKTHYLASLAMPAAVVGGMAFNPAYAASTADWNNTYSLYADAPGEQIAEFDTTKLNSKYDSFFIRTQNGKESSATVGVVKLDEGHSLTVADWNSGYFKPLNITKIEIEEGTTSTIAINAGQSVVIGAVSGGSAKYDVSGTLTLQSLTLDAEDSMTVKAGGALVLAKTANIDFGTSGKLVSNNTAGNNFTGSKSASYDFAITLSAEITLDLSEGFKIESRELIHAYDIYWREGENCIFDYAHSTVTETTGITLLQANMAQSTDADWVIDGKTYTAAELASVGPVYRFVATKEDGISIQYATAPEPATATLSLLALAGLCARRRRK